MHPAILAHSVLLSGDGEQLALRCLFTEASVLAVGERPSFQLWFVLKVRESVRQNVQGKSCNISLERSNGGVRPACNLMSSPLIHGEASVLAVLRAPNAP